MTKDEEIAILKKIILENNNIDPEREPHYIDDVMRRFEQEAATVYPQKQKTNTINDYYVGD